MSLQKWLSQKKKKLGNLSKKVLGGVSILGVLAWAGSHAFDYIKSRIGDTLKDEQVRRDSIKEDIRKLWITQVDVGELIDGEGHGPNEEIVESLVRLEDSQKNIHPSDWKKHFGNKSSRDLSDSDLSGIEWNVSKQKYIARKYHEKEYQITALQVVGDNLFAGHSDAPKIAIKEFPQDLVPKLQISFMNNEDFGRLNTVTLLTVGEFVYFQNLAEGAMSYPHINLADATIDPNADSIKSVSPTLAKFISERAGYLVPKFGSTKLPQGCFSFEVGMVKIDTQNSDCRSLADSYRKLSKVRAEDSIAKSGDCSEDAITFADFSIQEDPCIRQKGVFADLACKRSVEAFIRKSGKGLSSSDETHRLELIKRCSPEVQKLENPEFKEMILRSKSMQ